MEDNIKTYKQGIEKAKNDKTLFDNMGLFEMSDMGKNTHEIGNKGFKNGVSNSVLGKDWQIEFRGDKTDLLKQRGSGRGISPESWDERFKGRTLINSNVTKNDSEEIKELQNEVMFVWNDILTDKQREGIDILKIYHSKSPKMRIRNGTAERTLGTHAGRKIFNSSHESIMMSPSVVTININESDKPNAVLNIMIHEVSHNIWNRQIKNNHEKINTFTEKIIAMGKSGAITNYAGSYFNDLEKVKKENEGKWEEEVEREKNTYGKNDVQTEEEFQNWKNEQILNRLTNRYKTANDYIRENIAKVERLIANETHSEYFGMVSSPTDSEYHTADTVKLQEMGKLIKELYE